VRLILLSALVFSAALGSAQAAVPDGAASYAQRCATCHQHPTTVGTVPDLLSAYYRHDLAVLGDLYHLRDDVADQFTRHALTFYAQLHAWLYPARGTPARPPRRFPRLPDCPRAWEYATTQAEWDRVRPELDAVMAWIACVQYPSRDSVFCEGTF
jgi:hypothetical protein